MRGRVVQEFVTLDGVMKGPGGSEKTRRGGWAFQFMRAKEVDQFKLDELFASDALLLGRVTYQEFAAAWPSQTGEFADKMNGTTKIVETTTLDQVGWNYSRVMKENVPQAISRLKEEKGRDILVAGSGRDVQALVEHNLVDEFRLKVFSIILGEGKRLFNRGIGRHSLRLVEGKPARSGGVFTLLLHSEQN